MRIIVELDICDGHGECVIDAPELFAINDDATIVTVLEHEPDESRRAEAERAMQACPVSAIRIEG